MIIQLGENSVEIVSRCINASWEGKKDEVTFFSVVSSDKTKGNVYKLKHRKFHLNIFFFFFYCEGAQTLEQDNGVVEKASSLEIFNTQLVMVLSN